MKKALLLITILALSLSVFLVGCKDEPEPFVEIPPIDDVGDENGTDEVHDEIDEDEIDEDETDEDETDEDETDEDETDEDETDEDETDEE
ncbi:MAG: hypothetical protein LBC86_01360 [Oscillospiraceae bacterium]|jgi:hypothetical protein|nr:hypothetical protein [Oscillospiraceae bacterium]